MDGFADTTPSKETSSLKETGKEVISSQAFGNNIAPSGNQVHRKTVYPDEIKEFNHFKELFYKNFLRSNIGESSIYHGNKASKGHITTLGNGLTRTEHTGGVVKQPYLGGDQVIKPNPVGGDQKSVFGRVLKQRYVGGDKVIRFPPHGDDQKIPLGVVKQPYLVRDQVIKYPPPASGPKKLFGEVLNEAYLVRDQVTKYPPASDSSQRIVQVISAGNAKRLTSPQFHPSGDDKIAQNPSIIPVGDPMESIVLASDHKISLGRDSKRPRHITETIGNAKSSGHNQDEGHDQKIINSGKKDYSDLQRKPGRDQVLRTNTIGKKEDLSHGDSHKKEGHDQKIINSGKKDYSDLQRKPGRDQVLRTNTIGKKEDLSHGDSHKKEGHDKKIINSGTKDYSDLQRKPGRDQVVRTNTIGKKENLSYGDSHKNEGHKKIINSGKKDYSDLQRKPGRDQVLRKNTIGKKENLSYGDPHKKQNRHNQLVRIPVIGKKEVASYDNLHRKPHYDKVVRIPKIGNKKFVINTEMYKYLRNQILKQSKFDAATKHEGKLVNLDNGDKLEKITIALVELFNYVNDRERFAYEKNKKKVVRVTSFHSSRKMVDKQSKLKTRINRGGKIDAQTNSKFEEKLENVKYRLVEFFKFLNEEDFVYNEDYQEVVKPITRVPDTRVTRATDDDILENILNVLRVELSDKNNPMLQTHTVKKLPTNNYSTDADTKNVEKHLS